MNPIDFWGQVKSKCWGVWGWYALPLLFLCLSEGCPMPLFTYCCNSCRLCSGWQKLMKIWQKGMLGSQAFVWEIYLGMLGSQAFVWEIYLCIWLNSNLSQPKVSPVKLRTKGDKVRVEKVKDKKKKKKNLPTPKQMLNIDLLHQHTTDKLQEMETKPNVYNFQVGLSLSY